MSRRNLADHGGLIEGDGTKWSVDGEVRPQEARQGSVRLETPDDVAAPVHRSGQWAGKSSGSGVTKRIAPVPSANAASTGEVTSWATIAPSRTTATPSSFETRKSPPSRLHPSETRGSSGSVIEVLVGGSSVVVVVRTVVVTAKVVVVECVTAVVVDAVPPEHAPATAARTISHESRDRTQARYPRENLWQEQKDRVTALPPRRAIAPVASAAWAHRWCSLA